MNTRPKDPGPEPTEHMPFWKYGFLIALSALFDFLKAAAISLIFLAPFAVGIGVTYTTEGTLVKAFGQDMGSWLASTAGWVAGSATAAAEIFAAPVTASIEGIGVMLAIIVGLVGWLLIILLLLVSGSFNPFEGGAEHFLIILLAFGASVTPLIDAIPTFTPAIWKVASDLRKRDAKLHKEWEGKKKAFDAAMAADRQQRVQAAWAAAVQEEQVEAEEEAQSPESFGAPAYS